MKKAYESPEAEVLYFEGEDVITTSSEGGVTLPPASVTTGLY